VIVYRLSENLESLLRSDDCNLKDLVGAQENLVEKRIIGGVHSTRDQPLRALSSPISRDFAPIRLPRVAQNSLALAGFSNSRVGCDFNASSRLCHLSLPDKYTHHLIIGLPYPNTAA
jgi:hypothetical protein